MDNSINEAAIKKLSIVFTVVDRQKADYYLDVLGDFRVNFQLCLPGLGTASSEIANLLGLEPHKAVIITVIRDEFVPRIVHYLEEKFETVRNGKGICFGVPMASLIGVNTYQFLIDYMTGKEL